jgi:phospholipid-binding lipoprotein MlaA
VPEILMTVPAATSLLAASFCVLLLAGCATTGEGHPGDPFEPANRGIYAFNRGVDKAVLKPTAKAYQAHTPDWLRATVGNFFGNLDYPITIVNQLLQGKLKAAGQDTLRFTLNTTLGIGGLFDPASDASLPHHDEDLGQTLGKWGVPPGPYLMLPLLGPSHLRDVPSQVANRFLEPFYWYNYGNERWFSLALNLVDKRARLLPLDATLERAYDPYGFIREAYSQRRLFQVHDGDVPEELLPQEDEEEDVPDDEPATTDDEPAAEAQPD